MSNRTCSKCGESKPETEEFFRKRGHPCRGGLRPDCRDCSAKRDREWYAANRDKVQAYREANADAIRESKKKSYAKYKPSPQVLANAAAARARYAQTDAGKMAFRLSQHRRRARLAQVRNDLTAADWLTILATFGHVCAYCGASGDLFQEHVWPISKGGPNTAANVVPACRSCNSRKFQSDMEPWFRRQSFFAEARLAAILSHTAALVA